MALHTYPFCFFELISNYKNIFGVGLFRINYVIFFVVNSKSEIWQSADLS